MNDIKLGTLIWYMLNGRIHSAPVLAKMVVENFHEDWVCNRVQADLFTPFGKAGSYYGTCHGIINGVDVFTSKELLVADLLKVA